MAHLRAPYLTPVPLPIPRSRTQTHTMSYTYTPAPSPSPSSLEAWRNKPKRIEGWSKTLPPRPAPGERSWGKGVGVGSAEWSGTTAETGRSRGGHPLQPRSDDQAGETGRHGHGEGDGGMTMDRTDGGTEPTTFKNGRLPKSERAGEVVREQRRLGSQGSAASRSAPHLPAMGSGRGGSTTNLAIPVIIPALLNSRAAPTPFLALPSPLPPHHHTPTGTATPVRPIPTRSQGSDVSAHSARSLRDAFIESALHIPLDLLNEVQAEPPHTHHPPIASKGAGEPVRKSKSNVSQRAPTMPVGSAEGVRKAKSGASGAENRQNEDGREGRERRSSGVPLEPVKTWPRANPPRSTKVDLPPPSQTGLPARTSSRSRPANDLLAPNFRPSPIPSPQPRSPSHRTEAEAGPSSSVRTARAPSPALLTTQPPSQAHTRKPPPTNGQPVHPHRRPTPALRPALSRSGGSVDALGRRLREGSMTNLQTRFEPNTYPLPMSGTTASRDLSPVRPYADERTGRSMGSGTSHKARMPIHIGPEGFTPPSGGSSRPNGNERMGRSMGSGTSHKARMPIHIAPEAPTLTPGSSIEDDNPYERPSAHAQYHPNHQPRSESPRRHPPEIIIGPSSDAHLRVSHSHLDLQSSPRTLHPTPTGDMRASEEDRISFEIPSSGTRGRLRVSLAWFKDVRSPKRWRDRVGLSPSPRSEAPPPLPTKDSRWARDRERTEDKRGRSPLPRSRSPVREERYRADSPPRSRTRSPVDYSPRSRDRERERDEGRGRDYLAPPEPDRDRVRFSPVQPQDIRSPTAWSAPSQAHNPYLHPNPNHFIPSPTFVPLQQRQTPFPPYAQPGPWPSMSFPYAGPPPTPNTQAPPSLGGSIDPSLDGSPPAFNQPLPSFYPPPPTLSGQPYPRPFPFPGQPNRQTQGDLPWSGRPTVWQRMFSNQLNDGWDGEPRRQDGKEGWIRNWRSGVKGGGTTVFGGNRPIGAGYGDERREGGGWWRLGRGRGTNTIYPDADPPYRPDSTQRRGKWSFGLNRTDPTRIGQNGCPPPTYPQPRSGGTGIFSRAPLTSNTPYRPPLSGPLSSFRTNAERLKEERRAQRKERRDRRNNGVDGDGRTTLHPFDSVTRAGGAGFAARRPAMQQQRSLQQRAGLGNVGTGQGGGRVSEWVQRVSGQRNPVPGGLERKMGGSGRANEGVPWKERLKTRGAVVRRDAAGGGAVGGGGGEGKLRRARDSARQKRQAGTAKGFSLPFSRRQWREGGKGGRVIR